MIQYIRGGWTPERRAVADAAAAALAAHPHHVVRFLHPTSGRLVPTHKPPENGYYGLEQLPVCTVTRERIHLRYQGEMRWPPHYEDHTLVARIHDPVSGDVFYVSDQGEIFEVQK